MKQKEAEETNIKAKEERRGELLGSRTKIAASKKRTKGRMGAEKERTRKEVET